MGVRGPLPGRRRFALAAAAAAAIAVAGAIAAVVIGRPEPPGEVSRRAFAALQHGDLQTVTAAIAALEQKPGYEDHVRLLRGGRSLRLGDHDVAMWHFARVRPEGELREPALHLTGECLYSLHRLSEAENAFRVLAAEFPENAEAHRWLGAIYYDLGAMEHAISELKLLARMKPAEYQPYRLLGHIYADYERFTEAVTAYEEALKRNPPAPIRDDILEGLGKSLVQEHRYSEALRALEPLPDGPSSLALRAESHWSLGQRDEARAMLQQAQRLAPDDAAVLLLQARMARESGNAAAAVPVLERILAEDRHHAQARYQLALACRDLGEEQRYADEIAQYQKSIDLRLKFSELHVEAIGRPDDAALRDEIASLCTELGMHELATVWRRAAEAVRQTAQRQSAAEPVSEPVD